VLRVHESGSATSQVSATTDDEAEDEPGDDVDDSASHDAATPPDPTTPPDPNGASSPIEARPGQLTPQWRTMLALAWIASIFAYAAVWQASVQLGIGLWWVGPRSLPTPVWVKMIPFLAPTTMLIVIAFNMRWLPILGMLASAGAALVAIPDFMRSTGLALTELAIAAAVALVSGMSFTGLYRTAPVTRESVEIS
jgi:hypothetical protein